jgi:hypothetical protein
LSDSRAECEYTDGKLAVSNGYLSFDIILDSGVNPTNLLCKKSGKVYADSRYCYKYFVWEHQGRLPQYLKHSVERRLVGSSDIGLDVIVLGKIGDLEVKHAFFVPNTEPYLEEKITIKNAGKEPINTSDISFGFTKVVGNSKGQLLEDFRNSKVVAVPYRRECWFGRNGEYIEYSLKDLLIQKGWYRPYFSQAEKVPSEKFGSEGWAWTDGESSLLIAKHNLEGMEFSLLESIEENGKPVIQFGGAGVWHEDPEAALKVNVGEEVRFGVTRYVFVDGGWKECYYAFRDFMNDQGHSVPKGFNPPVQWNELYDHPFWWATKTTGRHYDTVEDRQRLYTLSSLEEEAKKAQELGCEALYLDPGWDTNFGSSIWAAERLLPAKDFVKLMKTKYGVDVSLHTPLAGWTDVAGRNATYPEKAHRKDGYGMVLVDLCMAAPAYIDTKTERLLELAKDGMVFFMFDGDEYGRREISGTSPCCDPTHGHSIPLTREEHGRAILKLARNIHKEFPNVLIELHPFLGSCFYPSMPTYYLHEPSGPDELWAFEYMWYPLWYLIYGQAISLYYYNLAYGYPLYIHIDLRNDNEHALEFWWYASTCRHLGVGGKRDPKVWEAHKQAMKTYKRLKRFYTQGTFYGLDETVHVHTLTDERRAVINVFNLSSKPETRELTFNLREIGLESQGKIEVKGASYTQKGSTITLRLNLPGMGTALAEITQRA